MEKKVINDPENYYNLSKSFENPDEANKAIADFYDEVSAIRKKFKIPDVLIVIKGSVKYENGTGDFFNLLSFGSQLNQVPMAAFAYGKSQSENREMVNKLLSQKE